MTKFQVSKVLRTASRPPLSLKKLQAKKLQAKTPTKFLIIPFISYIVFETFSFNSIYGDIIMLLLIPVSCVVLGVANVLNNSFPSTTRLITRSDDQFASTLVLQIFKITTRPQKSLSEDTGIYPSDRTIFGAIRHRIPAAYHTKMKKITKHIQEAPALKVCLYFTLFFSIVCTNSQCGIFFLVGRVFLCAVCYFRWLFL